MKKILKNKTGFTLVELLVVISIIGVLTIISASSFISAQIKARDSQRKSDLDAMSKSLMLYYTDTGFFPNLTSEKLFGNSRVGLTGPDGSVYMRETPLDPTNDGNYKYVYEVTIDLKKFNLFANLENKKDSQCEGNSYSVDGGNYCYGLSSPNTIVDPDQF